MKKITVLSTYSQDLHFQADDTFIKKRLGGPAFFLKKTLDQKNIPHKIKHGKLYRIAIRYTHNGEENGTVLHKPPRNKTPQIIKTPYLIISTILDEWPLQISGYKGISFIDLQGFARGGKQIKFPANAKPFCVKGTRQEVKYLNPGDLRTQKKECLIVTDGGRGVKLFFKGKRYSFHIKKPVETTNTVGAGDTFFGCFVATFIQTNNPIKSCENAIRQTNTFLKSHER